MKKVILLFPNSTSIADYVIKHRIKGAEVHSCEHTLTAALSDEELKIASKQYGAVVQTEPSGSFAGKHQQ